MKKVLLLVGVMMIGITELLSQNAIVGSGFTSGWESTADFEYFSASAGNSYIKTDNAKGTGNQYFRMGIDWDGTIKQITITPSLNVSVSPNSELMLNLNDNPSSGSMYLNVSSTTDNYIFKTKDAGSSPSGKLIIFQVQGDVRSVSSVAKDKTTIYPGQTVTITATLDGSFATGQSVYLRYSKDNFATSSISEMTGSGTSYSADIPSSTNTESSTIKYYIFTSGNGLASNISNDEADWYTINLNNNSGNNYSYSVQSSWTTSGSGDGSWNDPNSWDAGAVPESGQPITIEDNLTLDQNATVSSLTINNGATFTASDGSKDKRTLTIASGGTLTNNGTFTAADGTVVFAGAGTVAGSITTTFNDLELNGALTLTKVSQINGTLQINSGGSVTASPTFGSSSTLKYNLGGGSSSKLNQSLEWPLSNGPANIVIDNNTWVQLSVDRSLTKDLTVTNGALQSSGSNSLTMNGVTQTITISNSTGGAIYGTDNGVGNDLSIVISDGSTTTLIGDATSDHDNEKKFYNVTVNSGGTLALSRGILCRYGTFTVNGTLQINANGYVQSVPDNSKPASYSSGTLVYNNGGAYTSTDYEWPATNAPTNLIIQNNGTNVTLNNAKSIAGNVTVETGTTLNSSGNLTLLSDATGTASLIANGTVSGDVTVQRYLTPYYDDTDGKYHFISSPVSNQAIQTEFVTNPPTATTDFYKFDEASNVWINSKLKDNDENLIWNEDFEDNFAVGTGYLVAYKTDPVTKEFSGTLNNDASYEITCTHTVEGAEGWNLVGNPYPAAIDWDAVTLGDGMDNALYYYDSDKSKYRYYIHLAGESGALSSGSQYIPAMQGFMVHAKSSSTKTVTIEKADLTHSDQGFYKSGNASNSVDGSMKIEILTGDLSDETFIHFQSDATLEFDGNYDAYKLFGFNAEVPNIYTVNDQGTKFAINGLPASRENELSISLYLKPGVDGLFSLKPIINDLNTAITLEDLVTNNFVDLKAVEAYEFVASADDNPNRFILHFGTLTGIEDQIKTPKAFAYINGNNLHIRNMEGGYTLRLNDISGRNIMQQQINGNAEIALPSDLNAGVYLVEITSGSNRTVQKVVIN